MRPVVMLSAVGCGMAPLTGGDTGAGALFDTGVLPCVDESEPNDADYAWLGLAEGERAPSVCGTLSRTGVDRDGAFDGDVDLFLVQGLGEGTLRATLEWEGDADLYLWVGDGEEWWTERSPQAHRAVLELRTPADYFPIEVVGASGGRTDNVLTVSR